MRKTIRLCRSAVVSGLVATTAFAAQPGPRHVPSPDWRDQVIYFVLLDRFQDGRPSNNDQGAGEYDPADPRRYSGGDLAGLQARLDYVQDLGASTVWITPPVANQWWDGAVGYGGYHGYWAEHFASVDAHYGSLADYRSLAQALHGRGMYLVQDIVVNHTGNFFSIIDGPGELASRYRATADSRPVARPGQAPLDRNDARDRSQREQGIYHWTPVITDYADPRQERDYQLADLDDLNTENPQVRRLLRESYGHWIREVGVDAFRVDTAFYVPPDYFEDFLHADDPAAPGVMTVARETGREDFLLFGEGFGLDRPFEEVQARKIAGYETRPGGPPRLPAMINFPLYGSLGDVFARGRPSAEFGHRIESTMRVFADPHRMPTFVDNHDVDRFLAGGDEAGLRQALLAIMTLPGIPTIYYGTEQGFTQRRAAMFAAGHGSGGRDHFDRDAPLYRYLRAVISLRRGSRVFSRGTPTVLATNRAGPGALAYRMDHAGEAVLVAFNSAGHDTLLSIDGGLDHGTRTVLEPLFGIDGLPARVVSDADGRLALRLPPRAGQVWRIARGPAAATSSQAISLRADATPDDSGRLPLHGRANGIAAFKLVLDGDLSRAVDVVPAADGRWRAALPIAGLVDPVVEHEVLAWSEADAVRSEAHRFTAAPRWRRLAEVRDPVGDDRGPAGLYGYPADAGWTGPRPLDIRGVQVDAAGGSLRVSVEMSALSHAWNPANGFDHVAFTLFVALPGRDGGSALMPQQNATLPDGLRWHYRLRAHGWSNALFSAEGADADHEGRIVAPAAGVAADPSNRTVTFTIPAAAIGHPDSLDGARLYLNTWDYDGRYRELSAQGGAMAFSGGDGRHDPLWMDQTEVIELREPDPR